MTDISKLVEIMEKLLAPNGCPWDREQTPKTLGPYAIEEAHELVEAIEKGDINAVKEELGDVLLQVVFHSKLAEAQGQFTIDDVVNTISEKLVRRHPHVFADVKVKDSAEVLKNWDVIKKAEKDKKDAKAQDPFNIPQSLPALQRAQKIGDKTKGLKFDWTNAQEVFQKVTEEFNELKEAFAKNDLVHTEEELGDLFFVLAQLSRHLKFEAETVARGANRKFENRFRKMIAICQEKGLDFQTLPTDKKEELWSLVKQKEK